MSIENLTTGPTNTLVNIGVISTGRGHILRNYLIEKLTSPHILINDDIGSLAKTLKKETILYPEYKYDPYIPVPVFDINSDVEKTLKKMRNNCILQKCNPRTSGGRIYSTRVPILIDHIEKELYISPISKIHLTVGGSIKRWKRIKINSQLYKKKHH